MRALNRPVGAIRLQFVAAHGVASRLIAWWGNGYHGYSHVDALLPDGTLCGARADVIGGIPAGVQIRPQGYEKWLRRRILVLPCAADVERLWIAELKSHIGAQYDHQALWGFFTGRRLHTPGRFICSAYITNALQKVNVLPVLDIEPSQITPDSLSEMFQAIGATHR